MNKEIKERNEKLITDYGESKKTENTRKSYKSDVRVFSKFIQDDLMNVTIVDIDRYFRNIEKEKSNATLNRYIRSLYDFYDYVIYRELYKNKNPLGRTKGYTVDNSVVKTEEMTTNQFRALVKVVKEKIKKSKSEFQRAVHIRNLSIVMLDANGGFRISELLTLKFDNIDFENYKITLKGDETKGQKKRIVNFDEKVFDYLNEYLEVRNIFLKDKESDYIFLSRSGRVFDYSSYDTALKGYGSDERVGMLNLCTHSFRILYTVNTYEATGHNLVKTQMLVGHASVNQTRAYTKLKLDENELIKLPTARL